MSGGYFNYNQYLITEIIESIEEVIERSGRKKTKKELQEDGYMDADWYDMHPEELYHYKYPDEIILKFMEGISLLKKAQIFAQRIDWLLSCDDSEECFLKRLKEDLGKL